MCNKRLKFLFTTIAFCCCFITRTRSQNNSYVPTIIPPSPEAAALFKFTDIPVSTYTGTIDVNIPIYTIAARGVSIPISIDYHTGGIRVKEESGWVGLGWALNAGGAITRTVMDKDDFNASDYFTTTVPQLQGDISGTQPAQGIYTNGGGTLDPSTSVGNNVFDFFCNDQFNFATGTADYSAVFTTNGPSSFDMEPDIYSYSFAGRSGKFIITRDRHVILEKQDNIRIEFETNGNSFTITDDKGNVFYFYDKAHVQPADLISSPISSWNLSKIITQQKDSIIFNYSNDATAEFVGPDYTEINTAFSNVADGHQIVNGAGTFYGNELLQSIDFANGKLKFYYDNNRSDLQGGKKLDSVAIFSKTSTSLSFIKKYDLFYSYFTNSATSSDSLETKRLRLDSVRESSGAMSIPPYSFSYNAPSGILAKHGNGIYQGAYFNSIDHWGFNNGVPNSGLIPSLNIFYNPPITTNATFAQFYTYAGANREPDGGFMTAFSLSQVKYPTGGKTIFEYEANDYDVAKSRNGAVSFLNPTRITVQKSIFSAKRGDTSGTIDLSRIYPSLPSNSSQTNLSILLTFRASDDAGLAHWKGTSGQIQFSFNGKDANITQDISGSNLTCTGPVCTINIPVTVHAGSPMTYTWDALINPGVGTDFQDIRATIQFDTVQLAGEPVGVNNNFAKAGGGLRIKTITDFSDGNTIAKKRRFEYNFTDTVNGVSGYYSYGKLMASPSYARYLPFMQDLGGFSIGLILSSSSYTPSSSTISGNIVGYSQVNEYNIDPVNGTDIGKTVYTYFNSPDSGIDYRGYQFPGLLNMGNNLNGSLLSKTEYANISSIYQPVASTIYQYKTTNRKVYFSPKYQTTGQTGGSSQSQTVCTIGTGVNETIGCFYPSIKSERVLADSVANIVYDQLNVGKSVLNASKYFYDNPVHFQPTRTVVTDSKGNMVVTYIRYTQDYIPNGFSTTGNTILDTMLGKNIVSEVIEKQDSLYHPGSSSGYVSGALLSTYRILPDNSIGKSKIFKLEIPGLINNFQPFSVNNNVIAQDDRYRQMITFDRYDPSDNIAEYTSTDLTPVAILWDYFKKYPIAQVKNADSGSIAYTSFEADGAGNWTVGSSSRDTTDAITGSRSYVLNNDISKSGLNSATTYIVSYWTPSSTSHFDITGTITGYPVKGKTISFNSHSWTLWVHKVTGQSSITLSGSGLIDELRLYPVTAQMTTYTYSPLIGITSQCDVGNRITYYEYDGLARLKRIRDQDYNILKSFDYQYQVATGFSSVAKSGLFTRNDCSTGGTPSSDTYSVAAGAYTSIISQANADSLAQNDVNTNGQNFANTHASCTFINVLKSGRYARNTCVSESTTDSVTYTVAAGTYSSTISQAYADSLAQNDVKTTGQNYANEVGSCSCPGCVGEGLRCMGNGTCEMGVKVYTASTFDPSSGQYLCTYHYEYSDGSWSGDLTELNVNPCAIP